MKITGPTQIPSSGTSPVEGRSVAGAEHAGHPEAADGPDRSAGTEFGDLVGVGGAHRQEADVRVSDLAGEVAAGKLSPEAAAEQVLQRVLDRQLDPDVPVAVRDRVRAALLDALESDPQLSEALRQLR